MNLTRLRYFVAAADEGNIVAAARRLRVAQPALSRQLRALEEEVGTPLLERHPRGVRLTAAGEALLGHAREAIAAAEQGINAARHMGTGQSTLRMAYPDWPHRAELVGDAIALLRARWPGAEVTIDARAWTISPAVLRTKQIDVAFGIAPDAAQYGPDVRGVLVTPEPAASAVISARHPLAKRTSLRLADLRDETALIPPRAEVGELYDQMLGAIRLGGYEPRVADAPLNFSAATQMVVAGAGWIITVNSIRDTPPPGTVVIPLEDCKVMNGFWVLTRVDDDRAITRAFVECLKEVVALRIPDTASA